MDVTKVFEKISQNVENAYPRNECDYIDPSDGLLYCGKCHTAKQCRPPFFGGNVQRCMCSCEAKQIENEKEAARKHQLDAEICRLKSLSGMTHQQLTEWCFDKCSITEDNEKQVKICKKYADNFETMLDKNQGLLLWGGVGTGKTFSAACIANCLISKGISVFMTSFARLLSSGKGFDIDSEMTDAMDRAKLLIIDDLGAERNTDFALEKVYSIIDGRYSSGLPMILTTNLDLNEMQQSRDIRYQRVYERVLEVCYPVKFEGKSRRKIEASKRFEEMSKLFET